MLYIIPFIIFVIILLLVWEIWVCEGVHFGRRFVVLLYDLTAPRFDRIKQFDTLWERKYLGEPVAAVIGSLQGPRILDVGAGTGRLARSTHQIQNFKHAIICLEPSKKMTLVGRSLTDESRAHWMRAWAVPLPFAKNTFDLVVSLEMLEFTPHPAQTLDELYRVARPGGWLLITNRVGRDSKWIFGKIIKRDQFESVLQSHGFREIEVFPWQVEYDLTWARKPG